MDKSRLQTVLARINAAPADGDVPLSVEEAGLLQAFLAVRQRAGDVSPREQALLDRIARILRAWKAPAEPAEGDSRRQQMLLRTAIDKAQQSLWGALHEDEVSLLQSTRHVLAAQESRTVGNERLLNLLEDLLRRYASYIERQSAAQSADERAQPWLPVVPVELPMPEAPVNGVVAATLFQRVTPAGVELVGGCEVQLTVRTFELTGPTHLVGDLPSDVLLRVIDGSLTVEGFVSGHIVADGDIIVRGNVQGGWIISTRGNISIERALLGSRVIAESGAVFCLGAEASMCVFGWRGVVVRETALSSFLSGGRVWVGEALTGTTVEACGPVVAHSLEGANLGPTVVCLAQELSSEAYGRRTSEEVREMRRAVGQHERTIQRGERQMRYVNRLSQSCHRTAIFYLVGGVKPASLAPEFQDLQSLALHLEELIQTAESVAAFYQPLFSGAREVDAEEVDFFSSEVAKSLAVLSQPLQSEPDQYSRLSGVVAQYAQSLGRSLRFLQRHVDSTKGAAFFRDMFQRDVREWREQGEKTRQKIERLVASFEVHPDLLERVRQEESLEHLLVEVLHQVNASASSDEVARARSPLIRVLLNTVERNRKSLLRVQEEVEAARKELARIRARLHEEAAVLFADPAPGAVYLEADVYEAGSVITTSVELRQGVDGTMREVIALQQPITTRTRFVLEKSLLRRVESRERASVT